MKKIIIALFLFINVLQLNAQTNNSMISNINLSGSASKKFTPDLAVVDFNISARNKQNKAAIEDLQVLSNNLIARLNKLGFTKEQIKLTSYNVNQEFDYTDNKQRLNGYVASQSLHLEFTWDIDKLENLFKSFADEPSNNITLNYYTDFSKELKDKIKNELIPLAIKDAQSKAALIAESAKLKISGIKEILYNTTSPMPMPMMSAMKSAMYDSNAEVSGMPNVSINETEFQENIQIIFISEPK